MIKLTFIVAVVSMLAACSSMYGGSSMSRSDGMNNTATMGGAGSMQMGSGPDGSSGGGPN
jgi:hypothetical protein